jgi:hypothetical protein
VTEPEGRAAACTLTWTPAERRSRRAPSRNRSPPHRIERAAAARTNPPKAFITWPVLISDLAAPGAAGKVAGVLPEAAQLPLADCSRSEKRERCSRQQVCGVSAYRHGMSQYMAWPTADGVWHIGTGLSLPPGANLADLNKLLTLRHIDRAQIGFHRPNDEALFNAQFASAVDPGRL